MSVRNFYMDAVIGGRKTVLTGGPSTKDGGMKIVIYQRSEGIIKKAITIRCEATESGNLITSVFDKDGILMYGNQTIR